MRAMLFVAAVGLLQGSAAQDDVFAPQPDASNILPSAVACHYDPLMVGCPQSLGVDARRMLCSCEYQSNDWFHVMTRFVRAFRTGPEERAAAAQGWDVKLSNGINGALSLDVGLSTRITCGAEVVDGYPGTTTAVDAMHLYELAGNFIYPQVRNALNELCLPGRLALQTICLHAELFRQNIPGAKAYADKMEVIYSMVKDCVHTDSPWPFPGLESYLLMWSRFEAGQASQALHWWPGASMRSRLPTESSEHYWPCAELQDPACFPPGSDNLHTSCANCCDPGKGPQGDPDCFIAEWSFSRCCRTPGRSGRFY